MKHTYIKRAAVLMLTVFLAAGFVAAFSGTADAATTAKLTSRDYYAGGTIRFRIKGFNGAGICSWIGIPGAEAGTNGTLRKINNKDIVRAAYYGLYLNKNNPSATDARNLNRYFSYTLHNVYKRKDTTKAIAKAAVKKIKAKYINGKAMPPADLNFEVYEWKPSKANRQTVIVYKYKKTQYGYLQIRKSSTNAASYKTGQYNFKGCKFNVYKSDKKTKVGTLSISASSKGGSVKSNRIKLATGTYYVKESKSNSWYKLNTSMHSGAVKANATTLVKISNTPVTGKATVQKKLDDSSVSGGSVQGFTFKFTNKNNPSLVYTGTTDASGKVDVTLPYGTYTVTEVMDSVQSEDYTSTLRTKEISVSPENNAEIEWINHYEPLVGLNVIKAVDDGGSLSGFKFRITGIRYNSETISADKLISMVNPEFEYDESLYTAGEWVADSKEIEAVNTAAKEGKTGDFTMTLTNTLTTKKQESSDAGDTTDTTDEEDGTASDEGQADASGEGEKSGETPVEDTKLEIKVTLTLVSADKENSLSSVTSGSNGYTVRYNNVVFAGAATKFEDEIETDENGRISYKNIGAGLYTIIEEMSKKQSARYYIDKSSQTIELKEGDKVGNVKFENKARMTDVKLKKSSPDGEIEGIEFTLTGKTDFGEEIQMVCHTGDDGVISFGNLYAGTYTIEETGFNPGEYINTYEAEGKENPAFTFKVTGNESGTIWLGGERGAGSAHTEEVAFLNEPLPEVETELLDEDTESHLSNASSEVVLVDTVSYKRLVPGKEYVLKGSLMDKETGEPLTDDDGNTVTAETEFTPETSDGMAEVVFKFSGKNVVGKTTVAFETLSYKDGEEAAVHADIENEAQTVTFPGIKTTATDNQTGEHISMADDEVTLTDAVEYQNLTPGQKYELNGYLIPVENGEADTADENIIASGTTEFTPESADGTEKVILKFDASGLAGTKTVVFEDLFLVDESGAKTPVASHKDPDDEGQTIEIPKLSTSAEASGDTGEGKVIDTVQYTNLIPGKVYTVRGVMIDKESMKPVCEAKTYFTPETSDGSYELEFESDALVGRTAVAFEFLYIGEVTDSDKIVASHTDINDKAQTVTISKRKTPQTGDEDIPKAPFAGGGAAAAGLAAMAAKRRRETGR